MKMRNFQYPDRFIDAKAVSNQAIRHGLKKAGLRNGTLKRRIIFQRSYFFQQGLTESEHCLFMAKK